MSRIRHFSPLTLFLMLVAAVSEANAARDTATAEFCPHRPTHSVPLVMSEQDYPLLSVAQNEQGMVVLDFLINADGSIGDVKVAKSSGFARLDGAAVDAARQRWRFDPVLVDGKPISCRSRVGVVWQLNWTLEQLAALGFSIVHLGASDYPPGSRLDNRSGQTLVMARVGPDGKIMQAAAAQSSGYADLDAAAINLVKSGRWPVVPAQVSGKPVSTMVGFVLIWSPFGK